MVLGPRRSSEGYAPHEASAIAEVAHSVAGALDVLSEMRAQPTDAVLAAIDALRMEVRAVLQR
ncbi:MAG: hypothetical protein ABI282_01550 [Candidatus Baltobacteraceae bacterium]